MRWRLTRPAAIVAGAIAASGALAWLGLRPVVRALAVVAAQRHHLSLEVADVRAGWFSLRLLGVQARLEAMPSALARADEVRIGLRASLQLDRIDVLGLSIEVRGSLDQVRHEWKAWRATETKHSEPSGKLHGTTATLFLDLASLSWRDGVSVDPVAELRDCNVIVDSKGIRWRAASGRFHESLLGTSVSAMAGEVDADGHLKRARANALVFELGQAASDPIPPHGPTSPPALLVDPARPSPVDPLFPMPDTHALRGALSDACGFLSQHLDDNADIGVAALTWKVSRPPDRAFTLGPGPLALWQTPVGIELSYSTDPTVARTPLSVRVGLPRTGDPTASLEGGPVSLSLLGVEEGAAGLVDVAHTTVSGRGRMTLSEDGSALTFEGEGAARGLSIANPHLAPNVVRGLDFQVRARGTATADRELRVDDFVVRIGALQIAAGGVVAQTPDHVAASLHFELPRTNCQSLLDSFPSALLPALQGTDITGDFSARARFAFDSRNVEGLDLDYDVNDRCKVIQVPAELARQRFEQPFSHRIYLPDGTVAEESTGPGTDNWTPLDEISPYMQVAVLTTEDSAFPHHHGFNRASIRQSLIANLKARRFARGASTITMQVAKNMFLSRDKTLSRKLEELVLTDYLEQTFSKEELMELYLNIIEFGPAVYGITAAAEHYFGRAPAELHLGECLFLSSLLPAPLRYGAMHEYGQVPDGWMRMLRTLMQIAHRNGRITDAELAEAEEEPILFWHDGERPPARAAVRARTQLQRDAPDTGDVITAPPLDASP